MRDTQPRENYEETEKRVRAKTSEEHDQAHKSTKHTFDLWVALFDERLKKLDDLTWDQIPPEHINKHENNWRALDR